MGWAPALSTSPWFCCSGTASIVSLRLCCFLGHMCPLYFLSFSIPFPLAKEVANNVAKITGMEWICCAWSTDCGPGAPEIPFIQDMSWDCQCCIRNKPLSKPTEEQLGLKPTKSATKCLQTPNSDKMSPQVTFPDQKSWELKVSKHTISRLSHTLPTHSLFDPIFYLITWQPPFMGK